MLLRPVDVILIAAMAGGAAYTFYVKHEAEERRDEIVRLERQVAHERESIDLLHAGWSYLTQPARLQTIAATFAGDLGLAPLEARQIARPDQLPARLSDLPPPDTDGTTTASVPAAGPEGGDE